jgi:hypothetical protein
VTKCSKKLHKLFSCDSCDYYTCKKSNYDKHLLTAKHKSVTLGDAGDSKSSAAKYICQNCDKLYDSRNGLWKHKKTCFTHMEEPDYEYQSQNMTNTSQIQSGIVITPEIFLELLNQNKEMLEIIKNGTHNNQSHNNNSLNKTFNLQFFLNETCKNAMNIMDFVNSIEIGLDDLEKVGELGYVEGISNIINKNLKSLDITQRPIHCTDKKREILYIKDEDKWEKEEENKPKLRKAIKYVAHKNILKLQDFRAKYPDCGFSHSRKSDQYNKMIIESMGGSGNNDIEKEDKIISNIVKNTVIDKEKQIVC